MKTDENIQPFMNEPQYMLLISIQLDVIERNNDSAMF